MKRGGLGRGLDVLLPQSGELLETVVRDISIDEIDPNASQPRRDFDKEALEQLADSIREAGVLSPILVVENGMRYRIVAGERRYRAARLAGLETVPCIVRSMTNEQQMEAALIENLQRQDLNPIEEAAAIRSLMQECGYTQEQAARKLGKSRPAIANALRLLNLPEPVADMVLAGRLSAGHARALLAFPTPEEQQEMALKAEEQSLSVRELEKRAKQARSPHNVSHETKEARFAADSFYSEVELALKECLGRKVKVKKSGKGGVLELEFYSQDDLQQLANRLYSRDQ